MKKINILELELRVQQSLALNHAPCAQSNTVMLTKILRIFPNTFTYGEKQTEHVSLFLASSN